MAIPQPGDSVESELTLDADAIRAGARLIGDDNPLHHDLAVAEASRYGGLIASGAHTAALLAGLVSKGLLPAQEDGGCVGMDYAVRFAGPVRADRTVRLRWTVEQTEARRSGTVATLSGSITDALDGSALLTATMHVLYFHPPHRP